MLRLALCSLALVTSIGCGSSDSTNASCKAGEVKSGSGCTNVAGKLDGLRWEMPCTSDDPVDPAHVCQTQKPAVQTATLGGTAGASYLVSLRFRGVVEEKAYTGGTKEEHWQIGGTPAADPFNVYELAVSDPAQSYFVNSGSSYTMHAFPIDYDKTIEVKGGAVVTLSADPIDTGEIKNVDPNGAPIVVPGIPPDPKTYDGQFVQMDVLSVVSKP